MRVYALMMVVEGHMFDYLAGLAGQTHFLVVDMGWDATPPADNGTTLGPVEQKVVVLKLEYHSLSAKASFCQVTPRGEVAARWVRPWPCRSSEEKMTTEGPLMCTVRG
jgi:hypothetical protein